MTALPAPFEIDPDVREQYERALQEWWQQQELDDEESD